MASCEATARIAVDTNGNAFAERHQAGTCRRRPFRSRQICDRLHVALFLPFGDNNHRHIAANGGSRRFGVMC